MRRVRLWITILLASFSLCSIVRADENDELYIGTTSVRLGLQERSVVDEFSRRYRLVQVDGEYQVWVNKELAGTLRFCAGKLCHASAVHYARFSGDPDWFDSLFTIANGLKDDGHSLCLLSTGVDASNKGRAIFLTCGGRVLKVAGVNGSRQLVFISEEIGKRE